MSYEIYNDKEINTFVGSIKERLQYWSDELTKVNAEIDRRNKEAEEKAKQITLEDIYPGAKFYVWDDEERVIIDAGSEGYATVDTERWCYGIPPKNAEALLKDMLIYGYTKEPKNG